MMVTSNIREQFNLIAKQYDEGRRCFIPCMDDWYVRTLQVLQNLKTRAERIVDLGAGTGLLTQEIHLLYPGAKITLVDLSHDMLEVARQRFNGLTNMEYVVDDYSRAIPKDADIICSALSIHHLENDVKQRLFKTIYNALPEGGIFVNLDQFCAASPMIDDAWNDWWINYIDHSDITPEAKSKWLERKKLDREISIPQSIAMLTYAGFQQVDSIYQFMKFGTILAIK